MYKGVAEHSVGQEIALDLTFDAGEDRLRGLAVDSETCFLYWREGTAIRRMAGLFGVDRWEERPRRLRLVSDTGTSRLVDCQAQAGSLYVDGLAAGRQYRVEYGVWLEARFVPLLATEVQLPGGTQRAAHVHLQHEAISSYSIYSQG